MTLPENTILEWVDECGRWVVVPVEEDEEPWREWQDVGGESGGA